MKNSAKKLSLGGRAASLARRSATPLKKSETGDLQPSTGKPQEKLNESTLIWRELSPIISIAPITSSVARVYSFEVEIPAGTANLTSRSKIMVNQTRAIDKVRLGQRLGRLPDALMAKVKEALKLHYDLN